MFEQLTLLLSFIYALAITHLLSSVTDLIQCRARVQVSLLHLLWMLIALLLLCLSWLQLWPLHALPHWNLAEIAAQFSAAIMQYFTCSLLAVKVEAGGILNMHRFFAEQRPAIFSAFALLCLVGVLADYIQRNSALWWQPVLFIGPGFLLALAAGFARPLWLQWAAGLITLMLLLVWAISFSGLG